MLQNLWLPGEARSLGGRVSLEVWDERVKHRRYFDCVPGGCGVGHRIEEEDSTGENADGGQVGGTGGRHRWRRLCNNH